MSPEYQVKKRELANSVNMLAAPGGSAYDTRKNSFLQKDSLPMESEHRQNHSVNRNPRTTSLLLSPQPIGKKGQLNFL